MAYIIEVRIVYCIIFWEKNYNIAYKNNNLLIENYKIILNFIKFYTKFVLINT
jgi:hypothetical protein